MDFDVDIGNDNEIFSSHKIESVYYCKLTEGQGHKHDQRKMAPPFGRFPLLEKQSEEVRLKELSAFAQFSVLWLWVRNHFLSLTCELVCR